MSITNNTTKVKIKSKLTGNRRKDPKEYQKEFDAKFPNLTLLTPYITARQNVTVKCNDCGYIWQTMPLTLLTHKYGCTKCSYKHRGISRRQSQKDFWDKLKKINPNVRVKGKYVTNKQPIEVQCKICGYVWQARPNDLVTGRARCTKCGRAQDIYKRSNFCKVYRKIRSKKPNESYQLYNQHAYDYYIKKKHPNARLLTLFTGLSNYIKIKCLNCGNTRHMYAYELDRGAACLNCERGDRYVSKGERVIVSLLSQAGIHYEYPFIPGDLVDKISLHYDFRVRGKYLIEFQGEQHYRPVDYFGGEEQFQVQQQHDQMKREWAKENGFTLIEIKYNDPIKEKLSQYFPQVLKYEPNINFKAVNHSKKITIKHVRLNTQLIHEYNVLSNGLTVNKVMHKALNYIQKYDLKLVHAKYATASSRKNVLLRQVRFTDAEYKVFDQYSEQFDSASDELRSILHTYYLEQIKDNMFKYELVK